MNKSAKEAMKVYEDYNKANCVIYEEFARETSLIIRTFETFHEWFEFVQNETEIGKCFVELDWHRGFNTPWVRYYYHKKDNNELNIEIVGGLIDVDYTQCNFSMGYDHIDFYALEAGVPVAISSFRCIIYPISRFSRIKGDTRKLKDE
jgi:hypothetical protein